VVWYAGDLLAGHVDQVRPHLAGLVGHLLQLDGFAVVQDDDPELVGRVVLVAGCPGRVHDEVVVLLAARDQDVDGGDVVVAHKPQPGTVPRLEREHGPAVVHQVGDGDEKLDAEEDPSRAGVDAGTSLHVDVAVQPEAEVQQVQGHVDEDQEGREKVDIALDAFPLLGVVAVVQADDGAGALIVIHGRRRHPVVYVSRVAAQASLAHTHLAVPAGS
jgi:hypothetical protein